MVSVVTKDEWCERQASSLLDMNELSRTLPQLVNRSWLLTEKGNPHDAHAVRIAKFLNKSALYRSSLRQPIQS